MSYTYVKDPENPHVGGNYDVGDPWTFTPKTWDFLIDRFAVKTLMDLGSGRGHAAHYFYKRGVAVVAVDGALENVITAIYPTVHCDLTKKAALTLVDMVYCVEVAEHIPEENMNNLIMSFRCGNIVVMTHAFPGQGGYNHVNCQTSEYWIDKMQNNGMNYLAIDADTVRKIALSEGGHHMARSGLIFARRKK